VAAISLGLQDCLYLGNLDAERDWGHARDYVEGMWRMLQVDTPDDYVLSSGQTTSVRDFVEKAFKACGIQIRWEGSGVDEKGIDVATGKALVQIDPKYFRPTEVDLLLGDCTKAKTNLKWELQIDLEQLVKEMMESDLEGVATTHLKW
jgi:GDPmannose 4,6-dehydratase